MATLQESRIRAELYPIATQLLEDDFTVYYYPERGVALTRWLVFGKADNTGKVNTGTVQLADFGQGLDISASIKPSRKYGSSMAMWVADTYQDYQPYASELDACRAAAMPTVRNFMGVTLPNDGIEHFAWASDKLVNLTLDKVVA